MDFLWQQESIDAELPDLPVDAMCLGLLYPQPEHVQVAKDMTNDSIRCFMPDSVASIVMRRLKQSKLTPNPAYSSFASPARLRTISNEPGPSLIMWERILVGSALIMVYPRKHEAHSNPTQLAHRNNVETAV